MKKYIKLSNDLDPIVNEDNIRPTVEKILKELSKALDEDFTLTEFGCDLHDRDSDPFIRIYVEAESEEHYYTFGYTNVYLDDVISLTQVKSDISDDLYGKLINNVIEK